MDHRRLGCSNLRVSALCLGTMMFADQTDASEAADILAIARERGVNFVDTADVYARGASERMLGALIRADRDDWVLATKLGNPMSRKPNEARYARPWILRETDESLRRLGTGHIDILYLHRDYEDEDLEEPLRALDDLVRAGKIRYFGLSNFRGWRIAEVVRLCDRIGMARPVVCQPYYNLLNRMPEVEILPACRHYGIGVVPYSPIARGVLTGKYAPDEAPPEGTRVARGDRRILETEWRPESLVVAQTLKARLAGRPYALQHFAVAWVLANRHVDAVIAGPRTAAQWRDYFAALDVRVDDDDEAFVDGLVRPGHASTHGYSDPQYPLFGRARR